MLFNYSPGFVFFPTSGLLFRPLKKAKRGGIKKKKRNMVEKGFLPLSSMHPHLSFKTPAPAAPFSTPKSRGVQQREFFFRKIVVEFS